MKHSYLLFITTFLSFVGLQAQNGIKVGTDTTFEIATWNIEHFPKKSQITIDNVAQLVKIMGVDMFALQEIDDKKSFNKLVAKLPKYKSFYASYKYSGMAFLYNAEIINVNKTYKILTKNTRAFPRAPFVAELTINGIAFVVINNHYKCCGNGTIDNDSWDEEKRRLEASKLLKSYIDENLSNQKVIVLGDLNDELTDGTNENVFTPFLDDTENYFFADMYIAESSSAEWSYPSWPSHLDHILITNEVKDLLTVPYGAFILKPDKVMAGGFSSYDEKVSDHRPVYLKLPMPINNNVVCSKIERELNIYPNPASENINILGTKVMRQISVINAAGNIVLQTSIKSQQRVNLSVAHLISGLYFIKIVDELGRYTVQKIIVK